MKQSRDNEDRREFHLSRRCREWFGLDQALFSSNGNLILPDFQAVREFVWRVHRHPVGAQFPESALRAGQINAMGLIDEIFHYVAALYREQKKPDAFSEAVFRLEAALGREPLEACLRAFGQEFPSAEAWRREVTGNFPPDASFRDAMPAQIQLEEMLMLWLANANPAMAPYRLFFGDDALRQGTCYPQAMAALQDFFKSQPGFGPDDQDLLTMLRSPAVAHPDSLPAQLDFIRSRWGFMLQPFFSRLLVSLDLIQEEEKPFFGGPGTQEVFDVLDSGLEGERFSRDSEWMSRLVLLAKLTPVWLDQLSQKYGRPIRTLDRIPDEELDTIAGWGFSGLWLIGLWERSPASRRIKHLCGNPEAMASAYAVLDYRIAEELGGDGALQDLKTRARKRGIRLAADMVPNHMGIDSPWVIEHPDWFVSLDHSPFPAYRFSGPDLSSDPRASIFLDDRYYNRQDAAVVFKRLDRASGNARYIYHGNDGTHMPWNDTAQLNYLLPEVREAVLQSIQRVAADFAIIRFDAAMTLTKRHYQRLWFPMPGTGGDIPSRSGQGMDKAAFDRLLPKEFWREVVERMAGAAPDTLLLAEAFWLLEGYFVRTLGMHRVYNSAFMNFLKAEDNDRFRAMVKSILETQPEIMARFVNFLNNPDEETAATQFGKHDKYFGVCTLLATMPGLPMFGHGQVEGFVEKYGMEYPRAYWQERPDPELVRRHQIEIFPLLHRRHLFSGVTHFRLFDLVVDAEGAVSENVIAFTNAAEGERALVVCNNAYERVAGSLRRSTPALRRSEDGQPFLEQVTVAEALGFPENGESFLAMREQKTGLEFLFSLAEMLDAGLRLELEGYQTMVFLDFWGIADNEWQHCRQLQSRLAEKGVPSIAAALAELADESLRGAVAAVFNAAFLSPIAAALKKDAASWASLSGDEWKKQLQHLLQKVRDYSQGQADPAAVMLRVSVVMGVLGQLLAIRRLPQGRRSDSAFGFSACFRRYFLESNYGRHMALVYVICRGLGRVAAKQPGNGGLAFLKEHGVCKAIPGLFAELGFPHAKSDEAALLVEIALDKGLEFSRLLSADRPLAVFFEELFSGPYRPVFMAPGSDSEEAHLNPEFFHSLLVLLAIVHSLEGKGASRRHYFPVMEAMIAKAQAAGYRPALFVSRLKSHGRPPDAGRSRSRGRAAGPKRPR